MRQIVLFNNLLKIIINSYLQPLGCCIAINISITTVIHANTYSNAGKYNTSAEAQGTPLFRYERFYKLLTWVFRHDERDTLLTMLTIPSGPTNAQCILYCLRSLSVEICKIPTTRLGRLLNSLWPNGRDSIVGLHGPMSTANWLFLKSSNSQSISSWHDVIHIPVPFPVSGLSWQWWLLYSLRTNVKLYLSDSTPGLPTRTVQSPTKLNDKI